MKTIGERIRQAREGLGLSGEALAKMVGYKHQSAIGNLEARATGTGGNRIGAIADALDVTVEWLLRGPDTERPPYKTKPSVTRYLDGTENPVIAHTIAEPLPHEIDDGWVREAVTILRRLPEPDRRAAVANLRTFVHNLGPPRDGQDLQVAINL